MYIESVPLCSCTCSERQWMGVSLLVCPQYAACNWVSPPPQWTRGLFSLQSERGLTVVCVHLRNKPPRFSVGIGYRKEPLLGSPLYSYGTSILTVCGQSILFHANMMYFYVLS